MKKRNLLVALLLVFTLMITACGKASPFVGTWKGTCDLTDLIIGESGLGTDENLSKYAEEVEGLEFNIYFEFTEDKMSMSVDDASVDLFLENLETSMKNMMEAYMIDELAANDISYEEYLMEVGMDSEKFMQSMIDDMGMIVQMEAMMDSMEEALELSGAYMYDEEILTIVYDDNTYEEMNYIFEGDMLTIMFDNGEGLEIPIVCEMQK